MHLRLGVEVAEEEGHLLGVGEEEEEVKLQLQQVLLILPPIQHMKIIRLCWGLAMNTIDNSHDPPLPPFVSQQFSSRGQL